jgi:hypothetical protein
VNIELKVLISHLYSLEALKTLQYAADFHEAMHYAASTSDRPKLQDRAYKQWQINSYPSDGYYTKEEAGPNQ